MSEQEGQVQERLWALEDEINTLQTTTCNAQEICERLGEFVTSFSNLTDGERKLLIDSLILEVVVVKNEEVAVSVTPLLAGWGLLSRLLEEVPRATSMVPLKNSKNH